MCHLRRADLQPQGLIKLKIRDRLCIRTNRVRPQIMTRFQRQVFRLVKLSLRNFLKHPFRSKQLLSIHDQLCSASGCPYRCSCSLACMFHYLPHQRCLCDEPENLSLADEHADRCNRQRTFAAPADNAVVGKYAAHAASLGFRSADERVVDAMSAALKATVYACESPVARVLPPVSSLSRRKLLIWSRTPARQLVPRSLLTSNEPSSASSIPKLVTRSRQGSKGRQTITLCRKSANAARNSAAWPIGSTDFEVILTSLALGIVAASVAAKQSG